MARILFFLLIIAGVSAQASAQEGRRVACLPQNPTAVTSLMRLPLGVREFLLRTAEENKGVADVGAALERNDNSDGPKERLVLANVGVDCIQITVEYAARTPPLETFLFSNTDNDWTLVARKPGMLKNN